MFPFNYQGPPEFVVRAQPALSAIMLTRTGRTIIEGISQAKHTVTIALTTDHNAYARVGGTRDAPDANSTVYWNPDHHHAAPDDAPGAPLILGGQLIWIYYQVTKQMPAGEADVRATGTLSPQNERTLLGAAPMLVINPRGKRIEVADGGDLFPTENSLRDELGIPRRANFYPSNWPGGPPW